MMLSAFVAPFNLSPATSRVALTCCTEGPKRARKQSLPTFRERRYLHETRVEREKGKATHFSRGTAFTLMVWPLTIPDETTTKKPARESRTSRDPETKKKYPGKNGPLVEVDVFDRENCACVTDSLVFEESRDGFGYIPFVIPAWAYIVRVRAAKAILGKRAVQRNRAKRRVRAAAAQVFPNHGRRGMEYVFNALPEALTIKFPELVLEVKQALKYARCWENDMTLEEVRREKYCDR